MHRNTFILIFGLGIVLIGAVSLLSTLASHYIEWSLVVLCVLVVSLATSTRPGRLRPRPAVAATQRRASQTWNGTLRIWPEHADQELRVFPVRIGLALRAREARLLRGARPGGEGVVDVGLAGYDAAHRDVDLAVTVQLGSSIRRFGVPLRFSRGVLRTEDEGLPLSLELRRQRPRRKRRARAKSLFC